MARRPEAGGGRPGGGGRAPSISAIANARASASTTVGGEALADYELLELRAAHHACRARTPRQLAKELLPTFGSFSERAAAPAASACRGQGARRHLHHPPQGHPGGGPALRPRQDRHATQPILSSWSELIDYCRSARWRYETIEQFRILFLDKKNRLIADEVQQTGTVDHTPVYPREVIQPHAGAFGHRADPRPQPPLGRPGALLGRRADDARKSPTSPSPWASRCTITSSSAKSGHASLRGLKLI